ncbi:PTS-dependent dihydroxyacetone kinase phosphotransferase subunit DhaM [Arthrobacter sp. zg-Y20]|uniref:dihydroxyacetone kinase phosphoryl donor subunit DhaM n=1 Tax=unclassified Arthrobacter TaxID=235627 RepID=UPI001D140065|nr:MULTISPECIES: dihydroxyacetone kinase phosphoryl donor subunit DhaM [unclassified Arthrobacter]MCC3275776.1 PTS-dependent dihydroxyacetone kinase phosphotransferase subunit DhaM [Arthrobacter sp. zg-Y20]MDK1315933.1 dihydroxyacetone kinase phosphoryl donor subunit DhaM [Arthrobacter sp. zg.Y20]WIB06289.1 dihydroxyacetone kinase phosphoryl donor subunit DhaM [Arthrobacter sp. zg-Y20]
MSVGLVVVSHSRKLAEGVCELAAQMAADVHLAAAGGTDDDGIGTSLEKIQAGIASADTGDGVLLLTDLGSAVMTAEMALEFLDPDQQQRVRMADAALVEGTVAAAVAAQTGKRLPEVLAAAEAAVQPAAPGTDTGQAAGTDAGTEAGDEASGSWTLVNPMGLHARPAAAVAQLLADLDAEITINGVDGKSVMMLMTLGLKPGETLSATATGPDADRAIELLGAEVRNGFGEM